jgi:hypothetical protein
VLLRLPVDGVGVTGLAAERGWGLLNNADIPSPSLWPSPSPPFGLNTFIVQSVLRAPLAAI